MIVAIEKKKLDDMYTGISENIEKLSQLISGYICNDELESYMYRLLNEIQFYIKEAFNPELIELKLQLEYLRQKMQLSKNNGGSIEEDALFCKYELIKQKIFEIENPF
jgi:hypothetical protein